MINNEYNQSLQPKFSDLIIETHRLASQIKDHDLSIGVRLVADQLAKLGNEYHESQRTSN